MKLSFWRQEPKTILKFLLAPIIINIIIEFCSRRSFLETISYIINSPLTFLYNSFIILTTLSVVILFKRRQFIFTIISSIWIGFGITNGIVLSHRVTPFTATDLTLIKSCLSIFSKYLSPISIILIAMALIILIGLLVFLFFKGHKYEYKINYKKNILIVSSLCFCLFLSTKLSIGLNIVSSYFGNIAFAYLDYGFPYCFSNTLLNTGIDKPKDYSKETISQISNLIANTDSTNKLLLASSDNNLKLSQSRPNIIMLQLESFFDPTLINYLNFSSDPVPNFRNLKENYPSGYLTVPSVGAGTANTEFEILSGMSLRFFGPGEYPYKTILQESTCETINYDLKELGYSTHAIHNNKGTFYDRDFVFSQLGFDTFTSLEYMNVQEYTPTGWAKDFYLTDEILKSINSTIGTDFVYTISVQGHGDYPKDKILENPEITLTGLEDAETNNAFTYYVNQIHEMDKFLGELTTALSNLAEDTVLVLYGDHLPTLGLADEDLKNGSIFQTEYVVWSNFDLSREDEDLTAYQLTSSVLESLNINNGVLTKFHNQFKNSSDYLDDLKLLQYDMLYGEKYIYNGENPFIATNLQMGIDKITIDNIYTENNKIFIKGQNFNEFSKVYVNNEYIETTFIDNNTLSIEDTDFPQSSSIVITQRTSGGGKLGSTNEYIY
ncbi:LTA synthase family protein [Clostridium celatum]|uniref:LTA synthase family protein n=1 Tax=Clostridium celatum TaxID=36834 RepID=UPI002901E2F5|nr:LTA synthase family protein [Clostridium celatum]MDU2265488.1 LTA synthase family protein [Clostridium celatum]MDU6295218.1 LTA synthase family protein [Clostridium celatum]